MLLVIEKKCLHVNVGVASIPAATQDLEDTIYTQKKKFSQYRHCVQ